MEERQWKSWGISILAAIIIAVVLRSLGLNEFLTGWISCLVFTYSRVLYLKGF